MRQGLWWVILCCLNIGATELLAEDLIQLGPLPYFLVNYMDERFLKERLRACFEKSIQIEIAPLIIAEPFCSFRNKPRSSTWLQYDMNCWY